MAHRGTALCNTPPLLLQGSTFQARCSRGTPAGADKTTPPPGQCRALEGKGTPLLPGRGTRPLQCSGVNTPHGPPQGMLAWSPGRPKHSTGEGSWVDGTGILRPRSGDSSSRLMSTSQALWRGVHPQHLGPPGTSGRPQGLGFCRCLITESRHHAQPQPPIAPPRRVTSSVGAQGPRPGPGMFSGAGGWEEPVSEATHCRPGGSACRAAGAPPTPSPESLGKAPPRGHVHRPEWRA